MELRGKHILITGAGKRLGRAIADHFIEEGCSLTAHGHTSKKEIDSLVSQAKAKGIDAGSILCDLSKPLEIERAVDEAVKQRGPVHILINSASIFFPTNVLTVTQAEWDRLYDVNLRGQFFFARACAKHLLHAKQEGVIINLGDVNGIRPFKGYAPYSSIKAALIHLTRGLAKDLAPHIRVNSVSPGWVLSPEDCPPEQVERNAQKTLFKRIGEPKDIVHAVHFLVGNDYITGFDLLVDGGRAIL